MLELNLMNYQGEFTKTVEVEENELIVINIISDDWVMVSPFLADADSDEGCRLVDIYDGTVRFLATPENISSINRMTHPLDLLDIFGQKENEDEGTC